MQHSARRKAPALLALVALVAVLGAAAPAQAQQPNILLIVTDDQRWDTLDAMPSLTEDLVGKGVAFSNSFVVNPLCCPSRVTVLTGKYSHSTGVWGNPGAGPFGGLTAFDDTWTLPVWLQGAGYRTMFVGRYVNGYHDVYVPYTYVPPGWDSWLAHWGVPAQSYFDYYLTDGVNLTWHGSEPEDYSTDVLAAEATDLIRESGPEPFFLYFSVKAPHWSGQNLNVDPAPRHVGFYAGLPPHLPPSLNRRSRDKPRFVRQRPLLPLARLATFRQEQLESLLAVDEAVDGMLDALEETGKLADTLIVFTSDNGHAWGEHRWPQKTAPYEESLRVPLVIRWDALGAEARSRARIALNVDLAATMAEAAGVSVPTEGRSLLPVLLGQGPWRRSFLFEHFDNPRLVPSYCGFRDHRWKYVQYGTGEEEIYRVRSDPYELANVQARRPAMTMRYRERVLRSKCRPPGYTPLLPCTIEGTPERDRIRGTRRPDWVCAGRGRDVIDVHGGGKDTVRCGGGFDVVYAGGRDRVHADCERVRKKPPRPERAS
jgi:N-acetylglucosamine-6-sulfatase